MNDLNIVDGLHLFLIMSGVVIMILFDQPLQYIRCVCEVLGFSQYGIDGCMEV